MQQSDFVELEFPELVTAEQRSNGYRVGRERKERGKKSIDSITKRRVSIICVRQRVFTDNRRNRRVRIG